MDSGKLQELSVMMRWSRVATENRDFHENLDGRKVMSCDVRWSPRALLWTQKHSENIPGWFLSDLGTSENFRKIHDFDPEFRHKSAPRERSCRRIWLKLGGSKDLRCI